METVGQTVHALGYLVDVPQGLQEHGAGFRPRLRTDARAEFEIERKQRQLLPEIIVQVAREPCALIVVRAEQAPTQIANALVAGAQLALARAQLALRPQ